MFKDKKIFVLGMAKSGYEVAKLLAGKASSITVTDSNEQNSEYVEELKKLGVNVVITDDPVSLFDASFDYLVKNPGISFEHPVVVMAKQMNKPVINEMEVAFSFIPKNVSIIAITGTRGKTTTSTIAYEILRASKMPVHLAGNMGIPLSSVVGNVVSGDILVVEISAKQLIDLDKFHPNISVITNLDDSNLGFFKDYNSYLLNSSKILTHQTKEDLVILNSDIADIENLIKDKDIQKLRLSTSKEANICIKDGAITFLNDRIVNISDIRIKGNHNYANIMCAIVIAKAFDVKNEIIRDVLRKFNGVEHSFEYVREINKREFYNDSKSVNTKYTNIALDAFDKPTILIMGGVDSNDDFSLLKDHLNNVTLIIGYGAAGSKIEKFASNNQKPCVKVDNLIEAVRASYNLSSPNSVILFSPSCEATDQYKDFVERGNEFKLLVNEITQVIGR